MAWVTSVRRKDSHGKLQPTQVEAIVNVFSTEGSKLVVQIDTHGSAEREIRGKLSQTLQFGEEAAQDLFEILKQTYGFK